MFETITTPVNKNTCSCTGVCTCKQEVFDTPTIVLPQKGEKGDKGDVGIGISVGGTTGQYLTKNSNANFDTKWESIKKSITGNQSNIIADNGYGKLITTLNKNNIFTCEVIPTVGNPFKIPEDMLVGNVLFGFPNPATNTYIFEITYI